MRQKGMRKVTFKDIIWPFSKILVRTADLHDRRTETVKDECRGFTHVLMLVIMV